MVLLVAPEADCLYKILGKPKEWTEEPIDIQKILANLSKQVKIIKGELYEKVKNQLLPNVCPSFQTATIMKACQLLGHGKVLKTIEAINERYYWESLSLDVAKTISHSQKFLKEQPKPVAPPPCFMLPRHAFNTVSTDIMGLLATYNDKNQYILVAIDYLTKWIEAKPLSNLRATTTAQFILDKIINRHGYL